MGKLYFNYSTMNAGKTTALLQAAHNYEERGMDVLLLTAALDDRSGRAGRIASRIGLAKDADTFQSDSDLYARMRDNRHVACVMVDESQSSAAFLSKAQVWDLARAVDDFKLPIMCYGLRVDFKGDLFPGSAALLAWADELREVRTICHCGKKATMVIRRCGDGAAATDGAQVCIGGEETYESLCRKHFRMATGDYAAACPPAPLMADTTLKLKAVSAREPLAEANTPHPPAYPPPSPATPDCMSPA